MGRIELQLTQPVYWACVAVIATAACARCVFRKDSGSLTPAVPPSEISRWRAVSRVLRSPMDAIGCALFPSCCSLCGSPLPQFSSAPICAACWAEVSLDQGSGCVRCGDSLDGSGSNSAAASLCRACRLAPPPFVKAVACGPYEGRMRALIHALKYDRLQAVAPGLGQMLAHAIQQVTAEGLTELLIVPVPLHRSKHVERGFNQSRLIAIEAIACARRQNPSCRLVLAPSTLMRLRSTESQAGLTPRQRRLNVRGAFGVSDPAAVAGRKVLLVDDILTTGATARAASRVLMEAGADAVWVATLARARRIDHSFDRAAHFDGTAAEHPIPINLAPDFRQRSGTMNSDNQPSF